MEAQAQPLDVPTGGTENPQPYAGLLGDLEALIARYVIFPNGDFLRVVALWILHTWTFEACHVTPYLYLTGEKEAGKTRALDVFGLLARNAIRAEDMTAPIMFKLIERENKPVLMIDEVNTIFGGQRNDVKRRILDTGYKQGGCAWREQAREIVEFSTFSAKVLAGLNNGFMPDDIASRCITIPMAKKSPTDKVERFNEFYLRRSAQFEEMLERIFAFAEDAFADLTAQRPEPLAALGDRQNEIVEPLLAIANVLGVELEFRASLQRIYRTMGNALSPSQINLARIRAAFGSDDSIFSEDLCEALGPAWSPKQLALWLEQFHIAPKNIRQGTQVLKGYERSDFQAIWDANLEPVDLRLVHSADDNDDDEQLQMAGGA